MTSTTCRKVHSTASDRLGGTHGPQPESNFKLKRGQLEVRVGAGTKRSPVSGIVTCEVPLVLNGGMMTLTK